MKFSARPTLALVLVLVLAACGQEGTTPEASDRPMTSPPDSSAPGSSPSTDGSPRTDAATPEGWERTVVAGQGFSLALPEEWEPLSARTIGDDDAIGELIEAYPRAAPAIEQGQAAIASGQIALFAFDTGTESIRSGFASNVNAINVGPVQGTADDAAVDVAEAIQQQIPISGDVETETVTLPAGEAALVRYEWAVEEAEREAIGISVTQYAIIGERSGDGYILSMSTATTAEDRYAEVFRQIAESFMEEPA